MIAQKKAEGLRKTAPAAEDEGAAPPVPAPKKGGDGIDMMAELNQRLMRMRTPTMQRRQEDGEDDW